MTKDYQIEFNRVVYDVHLTKKRQRNIYYRFHDGAFYITAPWTSLQKTINDGLVKFGPKLIVRVEKKVMPHYSFGVNYCYLFGNRFELRNNQQFSVENGIIYAQNADDLEKNLRKLLIQYLNIRVREYEALMGIDKPYKISVKKMKTRYGSNSYQTHRLHFQLDLVHYSKEIIDSVIVHELAHEFEHNHQRHFYKIIEQYCPNYALLKRKLRKRIYQ